MYLMSNFDQSFINKNKNKLNNQYHSRQYLMEKRSKAIKRKYSPGKCDASLIEMKSTPKHKVV